MTASRCSVALVTTEEARTLDEDFQPLAEALMSRGCDVEAPAWRDASIDWTRYRVALLRSTWDYTERWQQFLAWTERVARLTRLQNPAALVRWNLDKRYLAELARKNVPVIPTTFVEPAGAARWPDAAEWVVKPSIGAGSRGARRFRSGDVERARAHIASLQAAGFCAMVQPYLASVDDAGETALVYFNGRFSHAVRKGPLLSLDDTAIEGLFAKEDITPRVASEDELEAGNIAIAALGPDAPLYARVDLIRDTRHGPCVLELELTEPSLFFAYAPGSAARLVAAMESRGLLS
jgi:O-ureido-D-serine cyclo-ligase